MIVLSISIYKAVVSVLQGSSQLCDWSIGNMLQGGSLLCEWSIGNMLQGSSLLCDWSVGNMLQGSSLLCDWSVGNMWCVCVRERGAGHEGVCVREGEGGKTNKPSCKVRNTVDKACLLAG